MKKITLIIALLSAINFYGQHRVATRVKQLTDTKTSFTKFSPLTVAAPQKTTAVTNATFATLNTRVAQNIATNKYPFIELAIPYNNSTIAVQLYRVEVLAQGFHADTDVKANIPWTDGAHYRGIVKGNSNSLVSFNFFNNEINGIISASGINNLVVGRMQTPGNISNYIIYSDARLAKSNPFTCAVTDTGVLPNYQPRSPQDALTEHCATVYFELNNDVYLQNNSDTQMTTNWMVSVFNNVQTLYDNDGITVAIKSIYIWTQPDPYVGESSTDYLIEFYDMRPVFDGDLGQLITTNGGGLGGVAIDIGGLCSQENVSYSDVYYNFQDVPVFSWTVEVITHELGHLLGSPHTHGCYWNGNNTAIDGCGTIAGYVEGDCETGPIPDEQGTIMSYCHLVEGVGINFANGFGPQPAARIVNHVESSQCLSTDCINTCLNSVSAFAVTNATLNSIAISWTDASGGPWMVGYTTANGTVTNWQETAVNTFTATSLNANTYYKFSVRPVCTDDREAESREFVTATSANWCGGATFRDTGGNGNYPNNQHLVRTLTPETPNQALTVTFNMFNVEQDYDYLYVYNGPTTDAPLIGSYTGTQIPGPFTSTAADGSLTFEFISDMGVTAAGWSATASCTLGRKEAIFTNLQYYPNPTNGSVTITSPEGVTGITVYNVAGQMLLNNAINNATTIDADIAPFANGVYFFKVTNGNKQAHFRIIKQ